MDICYKKWLSDQRLKNKNRTEVCSRGKTKTTKQKTFTYTDRNNVCKGYNIPQVAKVGMAKGKLHFLQKMGSILWTGRMLKRTHRICCETKHKHFNNDAGNTHPISDLRNRHFQSKTSKPHANFDISVGRCFQALAISSKRSFLISKWVDDYGTTQDNPTSLQCPKQVN